MEFEEDSEQEGVFNFGKLGFGYYQVVETEFPKGYITTDQKPIFQVRTNPDTHLREAVLVHISGENMGEPIDGKGFKYITSRIDDECGLAGKELSQLNLMPDMVPVMVLRGEQKLAARDELKIEKDDILIIGVSTLN